MGRKTEKKAQKAFVQNPDKVNITSAGDYIVLGIGTVGVHVRKETALIRYENGLKADVITGEILENKEAYPETLLNTTYPAKLTNRLGYTYEHEIARKLVAGDGADEADIEVYVLISDLKFFGDNVTYRISETGPVVVIENIADPKVVGMILPQDVDENMEEKVYE